MKKTLMYEQLTDLYPFFRESMEERKGTEEFESKFIAHVFKHSKAPIKTIIDLGGGIGMHAGELLKRGYDVTVFDQSRKALRTARQNFPNLKTTHGSFETIGIKETFDVAICMWSTFPYILAHNGRKHFFNWLKTHVRHTVILDEANFYHYIKMGEFHKIYHPVENRRFKFTLTRDWVINKNGLRKTSYVYTVIDKRTRRTKLIQDSEVQRYLSIEEIKNYLGRGWKLKGVFGDFKLTSLFNKRTSPRLISMFERKAGISKSMRSQ